MIFLKNNTEGESKLEYSFRDAMRRLNILHILQYDCVMEMGNIRITVADGNTVQTKMYDKFSHSRFPFYYTNIRRGPLGLYQLQTLEGLHSASWDNPDMMKKILRTSQVEAERNDLFISMYAYLVGKGQKSEYNKFLFYWPALNAMGAYFQEVYNYIHPEEKQRWKKVCPNPKSDATRLRIISYIINQKESFKSVNLSEYIEEMESCEFAGQKADVDKGEEVSKGSALRYRVKNIDKSCDSLAAFYRAAYEYECGENEVVSEKERQNLFQFLEENLEGGNGYREEIFTFFLLWYPYHWRNEFIHANRVIPAFYAYSDVETYLLKAINYFMENYIGTTLPYLFQLDAVINAQENDAIDETLQADMRKIADSMERMLRKLKKEE